ncbi:cytochrome c maturation protein CcmFN [Capsicum annuum]|nr:cytochrome c maturation protein CcmFN [Capsicum annuum]
MESLQKKGIRLGNQNRIKPSSMQMTVCCQPQSFNFWIGIRSSMFILTHHSMPLDVLIAVVEIDEDLYSIKKGQAPKDRNDQREASADANKAKEQEGGDDVIPYVPVFVSLDKYTY